jgi:SNF family Na+-dependent transporter
VEVTGMNQPKIDPWADGRDESENERMDRNWNELLQELRVTQTGTQILFGFLLAVAFQPQFGRLDQFQLAVYLILVVLAATTTALALAPVSLHRALFRRGQKAKVVRLGHNLVVLALIGVGLTLTGTTLLIFDVTIGRPQSFIAGAGALIMLVVVGVMPRIVARR